MSHAFVMQNICLANICFKCFDISANQTFFYQMWKCLSLQGLSHTAVYMARYRKVVMLYIIYITDSDIAKIHLLQ